MLGSMGGSFSELDFGFLLVLCLVEEEDNDLGRSFRMDEAEMVPKNRVSMLLSLLLLVLMVPQQANRSCLLACYTEFEFELKESSRPLKEEEGERERGESTIAESGF